jgi:hypothetical protein
MRRQMIRSYTWTPERVSCPAAHRTRKGGETSEGCRKMSQHMLTKKNKQDNKEHSITAKPMQCLVEDVFALEPCLVRGDINNRRQFVTLGAAVQLA